MRSDLIANKKSNPRFKILDEEIKDILRLWFDPGMLDMKQITWDESAALLEKLIEYEAVHNIRSWHDLKHRLQSNRMCFGLFHYKMETEPIIFIETAFLNFIPQKMTEILVADEKENEISLDRIENKNEINTLIFYSISNAQKGLAGIGFGNFLIKKVVEHVQKINPKIVNFITLSPIPGFSKWLFEFIESKKILSMEKISSMIKNHIQCKDVDLCEKFVIFLKKNDIKLKNNENLKKILVDLCIYYLCNAKNFSGNALDSVANFHLNNGAQIFRLNWTADLTEKRINESWGLMVNYEYKLEKIDENYEKYAKNKEISINKEILNGNNLIFQKKCI